MKAHFEAAVHRLPLARTLAPSRSDAPRLVRALLAGEAWAASAVWNAYAARVFKIAAQALGSDNDAEDLTQDVFATVFSGIGELRDPTALNGFVFAIALRLVARERQRRRVRRVLRLWDAWRLPDYPVDAHDIEARDALARLLQLLNRLRAEERTVFVLRNVEAMSLEEIASFTDLSIATVKRRLNRATERVTRADVEGTFAWYGLQKKEGSHDLGRG